MNYTGIITNTFFCEDKSANINANEGVVLPSTRLSLVNYALSNVKSKSSPVTSKNFNVERGPSYYRKWIYF